MLSLEDARWSELRTFFGKPEELPQVLRKWLAAIGTDDEEAIYRQELLDLFLHQCTIVSSAFAVVPWLVEGCSRCGSHDAILYMGDVAMVEMNRLEEGGECPDWLMRDYHEAISVAQGMVDRLLSAIGPDKDWKEGLVALRPALFGDAALAREQWSGA